MNIQTLNAQGVNALSQGNHHVAHLCFQKCLSRLLTPAAASQTSLPQASSSNPNGAQQHSKLQRIPLSQQRQGAREDYTFSNHNITKIFDHALVFEAGEEHRSQWGDQDTSSRAQQHGGSSLSFIEDMASPNRELFTIVTLYNLGLTLHLEGMKHVRNQEVRLSTALKCYKKAMSILNQWETTPSNDKTLLQLATTNNMMHIYTEFFDYKNTGLCIELLENILQETVEAVYMGLDGLDHFCESLFFAEGHEKRSAPSA